MPAGDGWKTDPFKASILDGKIFGRGAIDDKGPVISSLYAMKAIKDNCKVNSRIRLILGINEENDWKCISHYKKTEEIPTVGFSPDADFPCIYAEKGIATIYLEESYSKYGNEAITITEIDCYENAINVVPKFCKVTLKVDTQKLSIENITNFLDIELRSFENNITYQLDGDTLEIISTGIQAHAAHPDLGKNAISQLIVLLNRTFLNFNININLLSFFEKYINIEYNGRSLGIACSDESGVLTLNVGRFNLSDNLLQVGLNLRIPVNTKISDIEDLIEKNSSKCNIKSYTTKTQEPLYIPKDNYLVKTLCDIFNRKTGSDFKPIAIGGGTYARAFDNCVSFGANFPGDLDMCHQANEFVSIDKLVLASKIYAEAIYELSL